MFTSLRSRLLLTYVLVIGVTLCVMAVVTLIYLASNPLQTIQARQRLQNAAEAVDLRAVVSKPLNRQPLKAAAERVDSSFNVRVLIYDVQGRLLVDSRPLEPALNPPPDLKERLRRSAIGVMDDELGEEWLYLPRSFVSQYVVVLATPRPKTGFFAAVRSRADDLVKPLRQSGMIALVIALVFAFWLTRWISKPLHQMAEAVKSVPEGKYQPIKPEGPVEVQSLARVFNEMVDKVQATQQSQKDFVANVSHELKTPLTSIQGFAQAILDGTARTPEQLRQAGEVIYEEASRMHRLVVDLLDLARLDAGTAELQRSPVALDALLEDVVRTLTPQANHGQVQLSLVVGDLPTIIGDEDRLAQVFTNLVDNAIQHSPSGGEVRILAVRKAGNVEVRVEDSGAGIPPEDLPRIFERFYQVDKSRPGGGVRGTGLGLAIAKEIVESHGGAISVQSQPGQGSVFVVNLPVAPPDNTTLATRRPSTSY